MHSRSRQRHFPQDHHFVYFDQRDTFFASRRRRDAILCSSFGNLDQQGILALTAHQGIVFSLIEVWHERAPSYFPFFDRRMRTSSGRHTGSRLHGGQRSTSLPESGGGGVSRAA